MAASDIQRLGLPCSDSAAAFYVADSGVTALSTSATANTITGTVAANFDGTQPLVRQGWCMVEVSGLTSTPYVATIDLAITDGTVTVYVNTFIDAGHVAAQGVNWLVPIFTTLSDSLTTIKSVTAIITMSANAVTGNARVYFNGSD